MVMELFLLRGRSEKEMDGLDRFLGFEIVRTEPNICWGGGWIFTRGCQTNRKLWSVKTKVEGCWLVV